MHQHRVLEDTVYFWFGSNNTSGSGDDGATPLCDIRLAGATITDAPILSPTPALISHVNFPAGCYEVAVAATAVNGFAATNTYAVFCALTVDSQNPTGFVGSFTLDPIISNVQEISDDATAATNAELFFDGTGYAGTNNVIPTVTTTGTATAVTNISANGIDAASFSAGAIDATAIATGAIDADAIAANAIGASEIADGAIDAGAIASDAITAAKIANGAIDAATFAAGAIDATAIASNAITAAKIATDAITSDELAVSAVTKILTTQMTEAYAADGAAPTLAQSLMMIQQILGDFTISGTTLTVRKVDGAASAATYTLSDATSPVGLTRAS